MKHGTSHVPETWTHARLIASAPQLEQENALLKKALEEIVRAAQFDSGAVSRIAKAALARTSEAKP